MSIQTGAPGVANVEPNWAYHVTVMPNDSYFQDGDQWGLYNYGQVIWGVAGTPGIDIGAVSAWNISTGSTAILQGLVDTGIQYTHPDLAANVWSAPY